MWTNASETLLKYHHEEYFTFICVDKYCDLVDTMSWLRQI